MINNNQKGLRGQAGITLVEIIVVIFIITLFTIILITDFPRMLRQMALSRVTYDFAQDLRKTQDLGLSGIQLKDYNGDAISVKSYGVYIDLSKSTTQYIIYADVADKDGNFNQQYDYNNTNQHCDEVRQTRDGTLKLDCIVETIDIAQKDSSLSIASIANVSPPGVTSINFTPPGPITTLNGLASSATDIGVVFKNSDGVTREVKINKSGLISVE